MQKYIFTLLSLFSGLISYAQKENWQNLDLQQDSVFGISTEKAYKLLLSNKKPVKVIVAIIDSGIDTTHEDLAHILWTNPGEIAGNGIDDDHNGYIDDIHGWNYVAGESGKEDLVNILRPKKAFYDSLSYTKVPEEHRTAYQSYRKVWSEYPEHIDNPQAYIAELTMVKALLQQVKSKIGKSSLSLVDLGEYKPANDKQQEVIKIIMPRLLLYKDLETYEYNEIDTLISQLSYHLLHGLSMDDTARVIPGYEKTNGDISPDIIGPVPPKVTANHGTHVAGIIAADRTNSIGIKGIADNVQIMQLKTISTIREMRDRNLAKAIRYAADNGARILNLSFGKPYTWDKKAVDEAVKYAMQKDILIIHAAGNEGKNLDGVDQFPNPVYGDSSGIAGAWIQVGASGFKDDSLLAAGFSNYGRRSVDVFAPGMNISSTVPYSKYAAYDGTSMAAPVVTGLAALIREYYPQLSAKQVKDIIIRSVKKVKHDVIVKTSAGSMKKVPFSDICAAGGVVNAYNALLLAEKYK